MKRIQSPPVKNLILLFLIFVSTESRSQFEEQVKLYNQRIDSVQVGETLRTFEAFDTNKTLHVIKPGEHDLIYINLWATWCGPCVKNMPAFLALRDSFPEVAFYTISTNGDDYQWKRFYREGRAELTDKDLWIGGTETNPLAFFTMFVTEHDDYLSPSLRLPVYVLLDGDLRVLDDEAPKPGEITSEYLQNRKGLVENGEWRKEPQEEEEDDDDDDGIHPEIKIELDNLLKKDQEARSSGTTVKERNHIDSLNLIQFRAILDSIGWPTYDKVGSYSAMAAFVLLQHSNYELQKEYLPVLKKAALEGQARKSSYALLYDRVMIAETGEQYYGSQVTKNDDGIWELFPIKDPEGLLERREEMELPDFDRYLEKWGITWPNQ